MPGRKVSDDAMGAANDAANTLGLIDTHCHLHDRDFFSDNQADDMLARARDADVRKIVCIGTSMPDSLAAQKFATENAAIIPQIYWTFGVHPEAATDIENVVKITTESRETLRKIMENFQAEQNRQAEQKNELEQESAYNHTALPHNYLPVAIGEVGLDYHYDDYDREAQIRLLEEMLQLATDYHLPLSFHVREAFDDFLPLIANFSKLTGVVHSFSDNKKNLRRILDTTDFYIGVNGMATYSTLPTPPLERIVLETDAPFLTPAPFRGIINEPSYVRATAQWLADKLGTDLATVERETSKNGAQLYGI